MFLSSSCAVRLESDCAKLYNIHMPTYAAIKKLLVFRALVVFVAVLAFGLVSGLVGLGCQPQAVGKDAAHLDAGAMRADTYLQDVIVLQDSGRRDRPHYDTQLARDSGLRDSMLGPRSDAGGIRDVTGLDLSIGPRRDAAGTDQAAPAPGTQACQQWQDCAPHYGDAYSGYDCIDNFCSCDPDSSKMTQCTINGGQWLGQECFCVTNATPMPEADAGSEACWWSWHQDDCDPDRWVDTSYQEEQCYCCDEYGDDICDWVWVEDGYWVDGYCPDGYWIEVCP